MKKYSGEIHVDETIWEFVLGQVKKVSKATLPVPVECLLFGISWLMFLLGRLSIDGRDKLRTWRRGGNSMELEGKAQSADLSRPTEGVQEVPSNTDITGEVEESARPSTDEGNQLSTDAPAQDVDIELGSTPSPDLEIPDAGDDELSGNSETLEVVGEEIDKKAQPHVESKSTKEFSSDVPVPTVGDLIKAQMKH